MPINNNIQEITLTAGGGTENLSVASFITLYIIKGTATLTSNWTIQPSGTPSLGMTYNFKYTANIDLNGSDITIFGKTLKPILANKTHEIRAYWNGTTWEVDFLADVSEDGIIPLSSIQTNKYKLIPSVTETMLNGDNSPTIINAVQGEGTTDSELYYKVDANEKVIKIIGRIAVDTDETTVLGDLKVDLMHWISHTFEPSVSFIYNYKIPIQLMYRPTTTSPVDYTEVKGAYINKQSNFSSIKLIIPSIELGTDTNARYEGIINLELQYT